MHVSFSRPPRQSCAYTFFFFFDVAKTKQLTAKRIKSKAAGYGMHLTKLSVLWIFSGKSFATWHIFTQQTYTGNAKAVSTEPRPEVCWKLAEGQCQCTSFGIMCSAVTVPLENCAFCECWFWKCTRWASGLESSWERMFSQENKL